MSFTNEYFILFIAIHTNMEKVPVHGYRYYAESFLPLPEHRKYDFDQCALVCDYDDGMKGIMSKDILGTPTPIRFEDEEVWGVQKYDAYLSQKYGDYMTIPKQSGQRQHNFHYLDLNKPYRNFEV